MLGFIIVSALIFTFYCGIELLVRGSGSELLQFAVKMYVHDRRKFDNWVEKIHDHKSLASFLLPRLIALFLMSAAYAGFYSFFFGPK